MVCLQPQYDNDLIEDIMGRWEYRLVTVSGICQMFTILLFSLQLYKAVFLQTQYNNDLIEGNDRVYEVTCDENSFLSNTVYAHVTVL